ncbi:hypothetical protein [Bdellovibrio sp. HCB209]|uniref:hypothetical protein n=1 Tax=Bdellovibrio sp. HCB209 TaxID=3394354 RepID=UPI0039B5A10B
MAKLSDEEVVERVLFYRKMCGEFARRYRSARSLTPYTLSELIGWTEDKYVAFELGCIAFSDDEFISICRYLGAEKELKIFMENLEEAFNNGLKSNNKENSEFLESLGIKFTLSVHNSDKLAPSESE